MMLQLFLLKEMIIESIFSTWVRMKPWIELIIVIEAKKGSSNIEKTLIFFFSFFLNNNTYWERNKERLHKKWEIVIIKKLVKNKQNNIKQRKMARTNPK